MTLSRLCRTLGIIAGAAFLWTLVLSVSPGLHARLHPDGKGPEHSCAVTFVRSGSYDHAATPLDSNLVNVATQFATVPDLAPCWVASPFLSTAVFEHAPPFFS